MISAKGARNILTSSCQLPIDRKFNSEPFKKIAKVLDAKVTNASLTGKREVYISLDEISDASGLVRQVNEFGRKMWIEADWIAAVEEFLEYNGYKVGRKFNKVSGNWGIVIKW